MPKLPMPDTDEDAYAKNTKEQYEALGRFVEAFEEMIEEIRGISVGCIRRFVAKVETIKPDNLSWEEWQDDLIRKMLLVEIPFHHTGASAKPLFDTMKALIAEVVNAPRSPYYAERETYKSLVAHIEKEFGSLSWKRNDLLHGTWRVGYVGDDDPHASTFDVRRYKLTGDGVKRAPMPKNASELLKLRDRCEATRNWLAHLDWCFRSPCPLSTHFKTVGAEWKLFIRPDSVGTTLPEK